MEVFWRRSLMQKTDDSPSHSSTPLTPSLYNVCLSGKYGVGKTTLFQRIIRHHGCTNTSVDEFVFAVPRCSSKIRLLDTAGMERHDSLTSNFYRHCACILLVYDVTDVETLHYVNDSYRTIQDRGYCDAGAKFVAMRNKVDVPERDVQVPPDLIPDFLGGDVGRVVETSGRTGFGVVEFFEERLVGVLEGSDPVIKQGNLFGDEGDGTRQCCAT